MNILHKINKWIICLVILGNFAYSQDQNPELVATLKIKLQKTTVDTTKINILNEIAATYRYSNPQEGLKYGRNALSLSDSLNWKKGMAEANENLGICYQTEANYTEAINHLQKALQLYKQIPKKSAVSGTLKNIGLVYLVQKKYPEALLYFEQALKINQLLNNKLLIVYGLNDIADVYFKQNNNSKALEQYKQSIKINEEIKDNNGLAYCYARIGEIYSKQKEYPKAVSYLSMALNKYDKNQIGNIDNTLKQLSETYLLMSKSDAINKNKYIALSKKALEQTSSKQQQYSQSIDSLKESLGKATEDTTRINILNRLTSSYFYTNPKEGIPYGERALKLATKINWKKGIALAYNNLGVCQWVLTDYNKAINYFDLSLSKYKELNDQTGISEAYNNLGLVYVEIKKHNQAFKYFDKAFEINKKTGNKISMVYNLNNIASAYYNEKNYRKAFEYYTKSKDLNLSMYDLNGLGYCYSKIGQIYSDQKRYEESLDYFKKALNSYDKSQTYNIGNNYIGMGIVYYKMALVNSSNKKELLAQSAQSLNNAAYLFTQKGILDRLSICYLELYKTKKEQGDFTEALNYFEKHNTIKDSLFSNESQNKLTNLQSKREIDLRDKQIEIQKLKINSDYRKVYLLVTITITIAILFILFFWLYIIKRNTNELLLNKNEEISNINKQKDKFFSIIAHDLRGPFNGFLGLTELLAEEIDDMDNEEIQFAAINMRSSANNLNRLLENLLEWSRMEQGLIPFSPQESNLVKVIKECVEPLQDAANKKAITIETIINQNLKIFADHHILQSVIRNILSNALKFTPKKGKIKIYAQEDLKNTIISIVDSGIGMDIKMIENIFQLDVKTNRRGTDDEPSAGLGLILCKEFVEKHRGKIWVESEEGKGSTFNFSFPKNNTINAI
ncbi:tetratricopeptide repeat protein [Flavobacterium sp. M31R6]|uniref:tetratricopeptide repeat protein n=1 Tax=Flavobacterium sp. M31R6 TaxID=2739062 RepID=UPI0015683455|nr:tetratricopeptide repeat protein [Flavobacterium sp. M31R6]QKJ62969.1 tetratricopeptide repeat-containing sensor histidine kinase [Flavobacterium sp. M31R6]